MVTINQAFNSATGSRSDPSIATLTDAFQTAHTPNEQNDPNDPHTLLEKLKGNFYVAALMAGENDSITRNGLRIPGRGDGGELSSAALWSRILNQFFIEMTMRALDQAREDLSAQIARMEEMAVDVLGEEAQRLPNESDDAYIKRINKSMEDAYAEGRITEEQYKAWLEENETLKTAQAKVDALENRLKQDYENQQIIIRRLEAELVHLSEIEQELVAIKQLRSEDPEAADNRAAMLVANKPDVDFVYNEAGELDEDATVNTLTVESREAVEQMEEAETMLHNMETIDFSDEATIDTSTENRIELAMQGFNSKDRETYQKEESVPQVMQIQAIPG